MRDVLHEPSVAPQQGTDLRTRILREATRLFAERGYNATSVRELVEAAGCTKPALYYYFENKEALFLEAIRESTSAMTRIIEDTRHHGGSVRHQLAEGIDALVRMLDEYEMKMRFLMRAELQRDQGQPSFDFVSVRTLHLRMLQDILQAGKTRGEIRQDVDVEDAALALAGMVDQRLQLWLLGEPLRSDVTERVLRIFFRGVG